MKRVATLLLRLVRYRSRLALLSALCLLPLCLGLVQAQHMMPRAKGMSAAFGLSDAQIVYTPQLHGFPTQRFLNSQPGLLKYLRAAFFGKQESAADIIDYFAYANSISPKILITALEYGGGLVTDPHPSPQAIAYGAGYMESSAKGLVGQIMRVTSAILSAFYAAKRQELRAAGRSLVPGSLTATSDEHDAAQSAIEHFVTSAVGGPGIRRGNSASMATQFVAMYHRLFPSDPTVLSPETVGPPPQMALPYAVRSTWDFTWGPETAALNADCPQYGSGVLAAIDLAPPGTGTVTAVASGTVVYSAHDLVVVQHYSVWNGWTTAYLHTANQVPVGTDVAMAAPLAVTASRGPEPGDCANRWTGPHVELQMVYNGVYQPIDGDMFSGWVVHNDPNGSQCGYMQVGGKPPVWCSAKGVGNGAIFNGGNPSYPPTPTNTPTATNTPTPTLTPSPTATPFPPPSMPTLQAPLSGWQASRSVSFSWANSSNANDYSLTVSAHSDMSSPIVVQDAGDATSTSATFSQDYPLLYWTITASGPGGSTTSSRAQFGIDTTPPTGSLSINDGAATTLQPLVTVQTTADDGAGGSGVMAMRFSNDGSTWSLWEPYAPSGLWTLSLTQAQTSTVYAQYEDVAGNISSPVSASIMAQVYPVKPSSPNYSISSDTLDAGGGPMTSASYALVGVAGQSAPLAENAPQLHSPNYTLVAGFLGPITQTASMPYPPAPSSPHYRLPTDTIDSGGGTFASPHYGLVSVTGQPAPLAEDAPEIQSTHYTIEAGFLGAIGPLPTISPTPPLTITPSTTPTSTPTTTATPVARITLSRSSGSMGNTIIVTGTTFGVSETVALYLDRTTSTPLSSTTSTAAGSFRDTFTVPQAVFGTHTIIALGQVSGRSAAARFTILPRTFLLHYQGVQGSRDVLSGAGFAAHETVTGYWNGPAAPFTVTATTNSVGSFGSLAGAPGIAFTVPLSPTGSYAVYGVGQRSHAVAHSPFIVRPYLSLKPTSGPPGSTTRVTGSGYGAHETVTLLYDCGTPSCTSTTVLGTPTTNANGDVSALVKIPTGTSTGAHAIGGKGGTSAVFAASTFTVT